MPFFDIPARRYDLNRHAMLLDTNVLVKSFGRDRDAELILSLLEDMPVQLLVIGSVIVESWGMLVGRDRDVRGGIQMLQWLCTPGKAELLSERVEDTTLVQTLIAKYGIDCVDARLIQSARDITTTCNFRPPIHIATYDTTDFTRAWDTSNPSYTLYDMNSDFPNDPSY